MTPNQQALKPCPFCGSSAAQYPDGDMEGHSIMCSGDRLEIGASCPMTAFGYATEAEAAERWNLRAALKDKAGEVRIPAAGPSTFEQRFAEAVRLLTHASPPADMVTSWLDRTSEDLQHWIGSQKGTPEWAQSLAITDAAHAMAISPVEGEQHDFEPPAAQPAPVVPDGFALVPVEANDEILRPFRYCPDDQLFLAWRASIRIAASQQKGGQ